MAAGLPVVATSVGAIPRVIEGLLVPPDDPDALAKGILRLLDDPKQARDLALRTQQKHQEHFSREAMGERYLRLYQRLLVN
jgi:glycosyltransferase involved in cell wall biosynthesis